MKKIFLILIIALSLGGCSKATSDYKYSSNPEIEALMLNNEYVIVDVRTSREYNEAHLKDAINIPYDEITEDINLDKNKLILVYCKSGNRSGMAYNTLKSLGFNVYDLGAFASIDLPKE